ncbi:hypothetical protein EV356DRAFT_130571 [Viridothelium virens]|uniref:Uncharacterized protein n=1 Tax=Viridothelium virens TaxID=1048519 RepID=A0A6A6HAM9_VIRVR|nr:hypothetical protein EV356DRAFT_130571 [Viridothelium virens]
MDPLSVTASLIAVSGALGTSVKALQKVASLRHAPSELLSLHNEVNSLRTFLRIVNQTFQDGGHLELPPESIEGLRTVKLTLESHVQELDNLSQYQLKRSEVPNKDGTPKVARLAWLRVGKDIACLQRKIRDSRLDLQSIFSVLSLQSNIRVLSVIENVSLPAQTGASPQSSRTSASDPQLMQSISDLLRSYRASMAEPNIDSDRSPRILLECDPKARRLSDGSNSQPDSRCSGLIEDSVRGGQSSESVHKSSWDDYTLRIMTSTTVTSCTRPCPCSCHSQNLAGTSRLLFPLFGTLLYSYTGPNSLRRNACNHPWCKSPGCRTFRATYLFPPWLLERAMSFSANFTRFIGYGVYFSMRIPRVLNDLAPVWLSITQQRIPQLQTMISGGWYSVHDLGSIGDTLLHYAVASENLSSCALLLREGADPNATDHFHSYVQDSREPGFDEVYAQSE